MGPGEIRAIRGARSRAAFAKLLGVTQLTVLRWELPDGSKEARRPRAKMLEQLRKIAEEGITTSEPDEGDDDDDASEPARVPSRLDQLVDRLSRSDWAPVHEELLSLVANGELETEEERMYATVALVQIQLFVRCDVRGAIAALRPVLDAAERGELPRHVAARAQVLAALIHAAPDARVFDAGRVNAHATAAERLFEPDQDDLGVLLTVAKISAARFAGPHAVARTFASSIQWLERATSPLAEALSAELRSVMAATRGDFVAEKRLEDVAVARAEQLGLPGLWVPMLAQRAYRGLAGTTTPDQILAITRRAREATAVIVPVEPFVRLLGCEADALMRLARFDDAMAVVREGMQHAEAGGVPVFALVAPAVRSLALTQRGAELDELARRVAASGLSAQLSRTAVIDAHVLHIRLAKELFTGDVALAADLGRKLRAIIDQIGTDGIDFITHDAHILLVGSHLGVGDVEGARRAAEACAALLEQRPSIAHAMFFRRLLARLDTMAGRLTEARDKLESALATFQLIGEVTQGAQTRMDLALLSKLAGAEDAEQRVAEASAELARHGMPRPVNAKLPPEVMLQVSAATTKQWQPLSLAERLALGVERLALGLPPELLHRELIQVLGELLPGRTITPTDAAVREPAAAIVFPDGRGGVVVSGPLDADDRAVLRTLGTMAKLALGGARPPSPVAEVPADLDDRLPGFIAAAPPTRQLKREIAQLSRSSATILITGESGSGKEVVARAVHDLSARAKKPYVVFNCASIPRELFEGQLFGYRKGAFTGATSDNPGVIRAADGGTLFLDEIGELPLDTQPKLLRFLENAEVLPLGEQKPRRVDVRVLAATHRDLGRLVREGTFREDLYYRLNVVPLQVPPLRDRREDVVALARLFVSKLAPEGATPPELGVDAVAALKAHAWPGNVRELRNVIERAMAYTPVPEVLGAAHLRIGRAS
ncbi:MAG: sigma 54-interacting transcriptional regulator [Labilithrix sp.]